MNAFQRKQNWEMTSNSSIVVCTLLDSPKLFLVRATTLGLLRALPKLYRPIPTLHSIHSASATQSLRSQRISTTRTVVARTMVAARRRLPVNDDHAVEAASSSRKYSPITNIKDEMKDREESPLTEPEGDDNADVKPAKPTKANGKGTGDEPAESKAKAKAKSPAKPRAPKRAKAESKSAAGVASGEDEAEAEQPPAKKPRKAKADIFPPADLDPSLHPERKGHPVYSSSSSGRLDKPLNGTISTTEEQNTPRPVLLGAHTSAAGGPATALLKAGMLGANGLALFVKSQRKWESKAYESEQVDRFRSLLRPKAEGGEALHLDVSVFTSYGTRLG